MTRLHAIIPSLGKATRIAKGPPAEARIKPAYSVREDEHGYDVTVQLPGVAKDGLGITAQADELTIVGRRAWNPPAGWTALYRESADAPYVLTLEHDNAVKVDGIHAEMKDGGLRVSLPKTEAVKPRMIAIN